jgi:hypothetical protein
MRRPLLLRVLGWTLLALASSALFACSRPDDPVAAEPLAECAAYEQTFNRCLHRDLRIAHDETLIPKTRADQDRIRQVCTENLTRIQMACR